MREPSDQGRRDGNKERMRKQKEDDKPLSLPVDGGDGNDTGSGAAAGDKLMEHVSRQQQLGWLGELGGRATGGCRG